jgi:hypothetical protein
MINAAVRDGLRFLILPTRFVPDAHKRDLQSAYFLWKEVWEVAFRTELNVEDKLYSDNFTRQSYVAVLFTDHTPIVLTTLNYLDLSNKIDIDDSYFKVWPEMAQRKLAKEATKVVSCGNLALNFNFRRGSFGVSGKDLIFYLLVKLLKYSTADSMIASVRVEKGMGEAALRTGAHLLMPKVPYTIPGKFVDLVSWSRSLDDSMVDPEIKNLASWIWQNRTQIVQNHIQVKNQGEKYAA